MDSNVRIQKISTVDILFKETFGELLKDTPTQWLGMLKLAIEREIENRQNRRERRR